MQLAWAAFDARGRKTAARTFVIRPDGFKIPKDAEKIHGISTAIAKRTGVPIARGLDAFVKVLSKASVVVAHNLEFDANVLGAEFYRRGIREPFRLKIRVCTMKDATEYCGLRRHYRPKWPKLAELHLKLFGIYVKETHDAAADVAICSKCFFELKRLGVIRVMRRARR